MSERDERAGLSEADPAIRAQSPDLESAWRQIAWWQSTCGYWQARALATDDREHAAIARAEAAEARVAVVRSVAFSANASAILYGVTGTTPDTYSGISKDDALEAAGELVTDLRAALTHPHDQTAPTEDAEVWADVDGDYPEVPTEAAEVRWPTTDQTAPTEGER